MKVATAHHAARKAFHMDRAHQIPCGYEAERKHHKQGGHNAPNAPFIESDNAESAAFQIADKDPGDEIAADDKKEINPQKSPLQDPQS